MVQKLPSAKLQKCPPSRGGGGGKGEGGYFLKLQYMFILSVQLSPKRLNAPGHSPFKSAHNHSMPRVRSGRNYFEILNYVIFLSSNFFEHYNGLLLYRERLSLLDQTPPSSWFFSLL